tara:strand:- start:261 stop:755 length:495 start_codon:yes stop_codon:yes gene_type:complete
MFPYITSFKKVDYKTPIVYEIEGQDYKDVMSTRIHDYNNNYKVKEKIHYNDRPKLISTNTNEIQQLHFNKLPTKAFKRSPIKRDIKKELYMQAGIDTRESKVLLSENEIDNFTPMVNSLQERITKQNDIINVGRSAISTRLLRGNSEQYIKKCKNMIKNLNRHS